MEDHSAHQKNGNVAFLTTGAIGSLIAAPYVLPSLGIGSTLMTKQVVSMCGAVEGYGTGLAGALNSGFSHLPLVGETLASGGWANAISSGVIGIGGTLLGNYIQNHYDKPGQFPWGKAIKYTAMATSMLIALPSLLSGISIGVTFLSFALGGAALATASSVFMGETLGLMGGLNMVSAGAGLSGLLVHAVTCGIAIVPVIGNLLLNRDKEQEKPPTTPTPQVSQPQWQARLNGPETAMHMARA